MFELIDRTDPSARQELTIPVWWLRDVKTA
jgi:hypothetical protein